MVPRARACKSPGLGRRRGSGRSAHLGGITVVLLGFRNVEASRKEQDGLAIGRFHGGTHVGGHPGHAREQAEVYGFQLEQLLYRPHNVQHTFLGRNRAAIFQSVDLDLRAGLAQ